MFDVGFPELFIVAVLAIIVVGPKDLPKVMRSVMKMIKKVREMGSEFQSGLKKMADEVELDAVTRKLNEAGNIKLDDSKPAVDPSAEFSDYEEFDYDEYDYDSGGYTPTPSTDKAKEAVDDDKPATEDPATEDAKPTPEAPDITQEAEPVAETVSDKQQAAEEEEVVVEEEAKSKTDD